MRALVQLRDEAARMHTLASAAEPLDMRRMTLLEEEAAAAFWRSVHGTLRQNREDCAAGGAAWRAWWAKEKPLRWWRTAKGRAAWKARHAWQQRDAEAWDAAATEQEIINKWIVALGKGEPGRSAWEARNAVLEAVRDCDIDAEREALKALCRVRAMYGTRGSNAASRRKREDARAAIDFLDSEIKKLRGEFAPRDAAAKQRAAFDVGPAPRSGRRPGGRSRA